CDASTKTADAPTTIQKYAGLMYRPAPKSSAATPTPASTLSAPPNQRARPVVVGSWAARSAKWVATKTATAPATMETITVHAPTFGTQLAPAAIRAIARLAPGHATHHPSSDACAAHLSPSVCAYIRTVRRRPRYQ